MVVVYEAIWTSCYKKDLDEELMKALVARYCIGVSRTICAPVHISGPPTKSKRKESSSGATQPGDPPLFGKTPTSRDKKRRGGRKSRDK